MSIVGQRGSDAGPTAGIGRVGAFDGARVIEVVETTLLRRGDGTVESPVRCITQYWSTDGQLLAEVDPLWKEAEHGAR